MVAAVTAEQRKAGERGPEIPILTKIQARNLYLNERLPYNAIAEKTGLSVRSLQALACREGWTGVRAEQNKRIIEKQDSRMGAMASEVIEAIASASEQHAIRGLQRVGEALERNDRDAAKDFQALTAGVKNLATTARAMREPTGAAGPQAGPVSFNLFFSPASAPAAKQVEAVEVETKAVSEIRPAS